MNKTTFIQSMIDRYSEKVHRSFDCNPNKLEIRSPNETVACICNCSNNRFYIMGRELYCSKCFNVYTYEYDCDLLKVE